MPLRTKAMPIAIAACVPVVLCLCATANAVSLDDWRNEVVQTRQLADNDASQAYREAQRLDVALPANGTPADRARILNVLARIEIYLALTDAAARHVEQALDLANKGDDKVGQVEAELNIALNSVNQGRIDALVKATTHSMTLLDGIDHPELVAEVMLRTATMYGRAGAFDASMTLPMQAMDIAQRSNSPMALVYAHEGMAIALEQIARWNEAAEHYAWMRDYARAADSKILEAEATQGIGDVLTKQGRLQEGESLIRKALATYRDFGGPFYTAQALFSLASNLMTQKRPGEALALLDKVLEIYEKNTNKIGLWSTYSGRSNDYLALGRIDDAARDAQRAYDLAAALGTPIYEARSARQMSNIAAVRGQYQTAYRLSTEAAQMKDMADAERASARMLDLAQRYRTEAKQRKIDQLTHDAEQHAVRTRWLWTVFGSSVLLLLGTIVFLSRLRRVNRHLETVNTQLARSQNKLQATLDALPDLLFELGLDGHYYDYHSPRTDLLAAPVDALIGKNVQEILPPAAAAVCISALVDANETGKSFGKQFELALPHGNYWFELSVARKNIASSQEPHFIVLSRDITERKRMENLLHVRDQEFRAMVENSPDIVARYDTQCRRVYVNPAMQRQFGLSIEKILGKTPLESSAMTEAAAYMQRIQEVLKSAQESQMEFSFHDIQGGEHWGDMRLVPELSKDGEVVSVLAITRDITERKIAEQEIRKLNAELEQRVLDRTRELAASEERMRLFFERQLVGMAITSPEKGWIQVNDKICEMMGYSREELLRLNWEEMTYPEDLALDLTQFEHLLHGEIDSYMLEKRFVRKDGSLVFTKLAVACVRRADRSVDYVLALMEDITKRKHAEESIQELNVELKRRAKELEETNRELESFSYSVSHDLRTPLRAIDGYSHILLDDYGDRLDDEGKRLLNVVRSNASRMGQLIDDILQFSRTGRLELTSSEIDMEKMVRRVFEELQSSVTASRLQFEIEPIPPAWGDYAMMQQVLVNLLSNAIKFSRSREAPRIQVGASVTGEDIIYFVKDNGVGFDMRYADKLFGVFQRLHSMDEFEGTGIGLAIVKRIITRHGGRVWAESKLNEGTTMYFALPIREKKNE